MSRLAIVSVVISCVAIALSLYAHFERQRITSATAVTHCVVYKHHHGYVEVYACGEAR